MSQPHILLIGCGKMGSALAKGWLSSGGVSLTVANPSPRDLGPNVQVYSSLADLPAEFCADAVVLSVKPQIMTEVCTNLVPRLAESSLVLSVAAGKTLSYFENLFGVNQPIVRSMPNMPVAIGYGITALVANNAVSPAQKKLATQLLEAGGEAIWLPEESQMDAVTALSGSGPAYVFLLIEEMAKAGTALGLPENLALRLARQTVVGAAHLVGESPDVSAETFRKNIAISGGTTEAALRILMDEDGGLAQLMKRALLAAQKRSRELSQ
jgi:pyrroline-5-carboxylate reductase